MEKAPEPNKLSTQSQITIETSRLILRGAVDSDVDDLYECFSDAEVMRYWHARESLPHATSDVTKTWLGKMVGGPSNGISDFVVSLKSTLPELNDDEPSQPPKVIGKAGIWQGDEIGFLLNRQYWGKGFAIEALSEVIDLAFGLSNTTGIRSDDGSVSEANKSRKDVVADVDPRNNASLGILKKLGFEVYATMQRTFQVGDEWVDSVYLSLKREKWMEKREEICALRARNP